MSVRNHVAVLGFIILLGFPVSARQEISTPPPLSYAELMRAPADERERLFLAQPAEVRAVISRQRMEAWLAVHEPDLNSRQVSLVREAISLVGPESPTERIREEQAQVSRQLACALGGDLASTLTQFSPPVRVTRTWRQQAWNWMDWIVNCVV